MKSRLFALAFASLFMAGSAFAEAPACPANLDKTACVYFKEGYAAGMDDAKAKMNNAYQRHEDSYDSRFESAFSKGYEQGFKDGQKK
jgi:flagellar biosynthesis/type III secretory pathway protein FliH